MRTWLRIARAAATGWLAASFLSTAHAEPLRIFYFNWAGYGPFFLAQEKGFFAKQGIEVELINVEETHAAYAGLFRGHVHAVAAVLQDAPFFSTPDDVLKCVLALHEDHGATGIVVNEDVEMVADLVDKVVAFEKGSASHFFLSVMLQDADLHEADIKVVDVPDADGTTAFLLQEVDAVATWGAMLIEAKQAPHAHLLTDTSEHPGLIVDCLFTTAQQLQDRGADFKALGRAWDTAVNYVQAHPQEAIQIMAERMGGAHGDPEIFAETLENLRLYDGEQNREFFGTPDRPGQIYQTAQHAIEVWRDLGVLDFDLKPADIVARGVWSE